MDLTSLVVIRHSTKAHILHESLRRELQPTTGWDGGVDQIFEGTQPMLTRVKFVKKAQRLGFSLDEIVEWLRLEDSAHCKETSDLAERKLQDIRGKLADLASMEAGLAALVRACRAPKGNVSCPLIASLQQGTNHVEKR